MPNLPRLALIALALIALALPSLGMLSLAGCRNETAPTAAPDAPAAASARAPAPASPTFAKRVLASGLTSPHALLWGPMGRSGSPSAPSARSRASIRPPASARKYSPCPIWSTPRARTAWSASSCIRTAEAERLFETTNRYRDVLVSPDGRTFYVATDSAGPTKGADGAATTTLENPGAIAAPANP